MESDAHPQDMPVYPTRLEITQPETQRRLTNFPLFIGTLIRLVLLIPSYLMLYYLMFGALIGYVAATFVITLRGRYPRGIFKLLVGIHRWEANITAYFLHLFDDYPPLDLDQRLDRALQLEVDYPQHPSRWLNAPGIGFAIKAVILIPHFLVLNALYFLASVIVLIGQVAILFNRRFPPGLHQMVVGFVRWEHRVTGYLFGLTDKYPPFSLS